MRECAKRNISEVKVSFSERWKQKCERFLNSLTHLIRKVHIFFIFDFLLFTQEPKYFQKINIP